MKKILLTVCMLGFATAGYAAFAPGTGIQVGYER